MSSSSEDPSRVAAPPSKWHAAFRSITQGSAIISVLAVVLALLVGGLLIAVTNEDVQAVSICTPNAFHAPATIQSGAVIILCKPRLCGLADIQKFF